MVHETPLNLNLSSSDETYSFILDNRYGFSRMAGSTFRKFWITHLELYQQVVKQTLDVHLNIIRNLLSNINRVIKNLSVHLGSYLKLCTLSVSPRKLNRKLSTKNVRNLIPITNLEATAKKLRAGTQKNISAAIYRDKLAFQLSIKTLLGSINIRRASRDQ